MSLVTFPIAVDRSTSYDTMRGWISKRLWSGAFIYLLIAYGYIISLALCVLMGWCLTLSGHQQKKCWFSHYFLYCMCFPQMSTFNDILTLCVLMGWCLALSGHQQKQCWFSQCLLYCTCFLQMSTFNDEIPWNPSDESHRSLLMISQHWFR